jgi:uncharacterized protein (DUF58 family)
MKTRSTMNSMIIAGTIAFGGLGGAVSASAATGTATTNPDLTVTVSVSPDVLRAGNTATVTESVTNNTGVTQTVTLSNTLLTPKGQTLTRPAQTIAVPAGATFTVAPEQYVIKGADPKGTYSLTFSATDGNGTSSATTQYAVTK